MKNFYLIQILVLASLGLQAHVWRINNNPGVNSNFPTFTAAQNIAVNGDTLYFEGSTLSYGDITVTKQLVFFGPGYFLTENPQTQANPISAQFGIVNFNAGSSNSELSGFIVNTINISISNITIKGTCFMCGIAINASTSLANIFILTNYFQSSNYGCASISKSTGNSIVNNVVISNNYLRSTYLPSNINSVITNNIFDGNVDVYNSIISNNVQKSGNQTLNNNYYYYNIGSGTQFPAGNGNQQSIDMANVFVGLTGYSTDGQWQLKEFSPAIGAGNDGLDCGMYGGTNPYILSGLHDIPAIYQIIMPTTGNSNTGLNVTVKAKIH